MDRTERAFCYSKNFSINYKSERILRVNAHISHLLNSRRRIHTRHIEKALIRYRFFNQEDQISTLKEIKRNYLNKNINIIGSSADQTNHERTITKINKLIDDLEDDSASEISDKEISHSTSSRRHVVKNKNYKKRSYDPNYMTIKTDEISLKQSTSDCFAVSFFHLFLKSRSEINLAKYIQYYDEELILRILESIYKPSKEVLHDLFEQGYRPECNNEGYLIRMSMTYKKLNAIRDSNKNIVVNSPSNITKGQRKRLIDLVHILSHLNGRINICEQKQLLNPIAENSDASMESYNLKNGDPTHFAEIVGLKEKYQISLHDFIKYYDKLSDKIVKKEVLITVGVYYKISYKSLVKEVGHALSLIKFSPENNTFLIYNPHGREETYYYSELLPYKPIISIFCDSEITLEALFNNSIPYDIYSTYELSPHPIYSELYIQQKYDRITCYKHAYSNIYGHKYLSLSGIHIINSQLMLFDRGVLVKSNIKFVTFLNILYQEYIDIKNQLVVEAFNGVYKNKVYRDGNLMTNFDSNNLLHADSDENGDMKLNRIQYHQFN